MTLERDPKLVSRRRFLSATAAGFGTLALVACGARPPPLLRPKAALRQPAKPRPPPRAKPRLPPKPRWPRRRRRSCSAPAARKSSSGTASAAPTAPRWCRCCSNIRPTIPTSQLSSETYDWDVFYQKLPTATAAGTPPNLGIMHSWGIEQFAAQGIHPGRRHAVLLRRPGAQGRFQPRDDRGDFG